MAELRGGRDEPDDSGLPARRYPADASDDTGEARPRAEPDPRAEYAAVMQQIVDQGQPSKRQPDQAPSSQPEAAPANANQAAADHADGAQESTNQEDADQEAASPADTAQDSAADADKADIGQADADPEDADPEGIGQDTADPADADQAAEPLDGGALKRFEPSRAGLPEVSYDDAAAYIEEHLDDRPWLAAVRECSPDTQRIFVALDQGHGHAHIRHDGWVTEERNERRVRNLEDPAQLDPDKRIAHVDGIKTGDKTHRCGGIATRINDPEAFAMAIARAIEHPDMRAALDSTGSVPKPVNLPISEILGDDGHKYCSGWRLEPVNGSMDDARANRKAWVAGDHSGLEPRARPVETFEGGTVTFVFHPKAGGGHEISTVYANPPAEQQGEM
jgi:hypothetical protein